MKIRDSKLYRVYGTFEQYCRERWNITRIHAFRLIEASEVVKNVEMLPIGNNILPRTESQARPLTKLEPAEQKRSGGFSRFNRCMSGFFFEMWEKMR